MTKYIFPALFEAGDEDEQGYTVSFPDLQGCITEGDTLEEAIHMAKDALAGYLLTSEEDGDKIPAASNLRIESFHLDNFILDIEVDTDNFLK
ncbi:MAG: type II toxin-antitoxin system HicB family antitoxin [Psychrobacillus psychrodurans]